MPMFDFHCGACGADFERLARADDPAPPCPQCGGASQRQLSRLAPAGKTASMVQGARRQAAREGHFSHYSQAERSKLPR
jgi:putative FmdB family regulatory protein